MATKKPTPPSSGNVPGTKSTREKRADIKAKAKAATEARRLAAKRKQQRNTAILVVLALLVVGLVAWWMVSSSNAKKNSADPAGATSSFGLMVGNQDAATTVVIYEDFLCPGCGYVENQTSEALTKAAAAGTVSVEYRPFKLLGLDYSELSAQTFWAVLDQAGPEVAKTFHDALFADQPEESGKHPGKDELVAMAVKAGADKSKIRAALDDGTFEGYVARSNDAASKAKVNSTPTVIINGVREDTSTSEGLQATVDKLRAFGEIPVPAAP